eukprot:2952425-Pyramimonas_sp.AAC.1
MGCDPQGLLRDPGTRCARGARRRPDRMMRVESPLNRCHPGRALPRDERVASRFERKGDGGR